VKQDEPSFVPSEIFLNALQSRSTLVFCSHGETLFCQGDAPVGIYILRQGRAKLTIHGVEGEATFAVKSAPGSLLGLPAVISHQPYSLTAKAEDGAELSFIPYDAFHDLIRTDPGLAFEALQALAAEIHAARRAASMV